jgi:Flp pilus assembly protein TadG
MTISTPSIPGRPGALRRVVSHDGGMAAVEFALILPILVVLWIGGVEVTQALSVDRRLNNLASAIGDLTARSKTMCYAKIDAIFDIAPGALEPFSTNGLGMRVSAVDVDDDGDAKVAWTRAEGPIPTGAYQVNGSMNAVVPESLRVPDSQIIVAEAYYTYQPAVGYVITGEIELDDRMFFVPRLTQFVTLVSNNDDGCQT